MTETMHYGQAVVARHLRSNVLRGAGAEKMEARRRALERLIAAVRDELGDSVAAMRMEPGPVGLAVHCASPDPQAPQALRRYLLDEGKGVYFPFDDRGQYESVVENDRRTEELLLSLEGGAITPDRLEAFFGPADAPQHD